MPRVYLHELVDVDGTQRSRYQHHMTANWCPEAGHLRRQLCFGVFTLVGSTGTWPTVVNMWEYASWEDLAHNFSVELVGAGHRDPMLQEWWARAAAFRSGGRDRVLVAHDASPGVEDWCARGGTGAVAYTQEVVRVTPGGAPELADALAHAAGTGHGDEMVGRFGMALVGLFRTALGADDEVVVLRAVPDWASWAAAEAHLSSPEVAADPEAAPRGSVARAVADSGPHLVASERTLLVDAELSPLRTGRQPRAEDRRPLDEV